MTKEEKKAAFDFLNFAAAYVSGQSRSDFDAPFFSDDGSQSEAASADFERFGRGSKSPLCLAVFRAKSTESRALTEKMLSTISLFAEKNAFLADSDLLAAEQNSLQALVAALRPKAILFFEEGKFARGKIFDFAGIPAAATFEADSLLKNPALKRGAWGDLKFFREKLLTIDAEYGRQA